jgi:hypothetical protein
MRTRQYVEDRGSADATKDAVLKWTLFPTMGVLLILAIAVENGALQGSREARLERLLVPESRSALLEMVPDRTIALASHLENVARRATMRLDAERILECHLHKDGHITPFVRDQLRIKDGKPWVPGPEFSAPLDALCGAMISFAIDSMNRG